MMKATYRLEEVDYIKATLTITMSIGAWKKLKGNIEGTAEPQWSFKRHIQNMIDKANTVYGEEVVGGE